MTLAKRIIPCLDVSDGRVVKGVKFSLLKDAGNPVELAKKYSHECADELVFLDISASKQGRKNSISLARNVAQVIDIPLTFGGGISSIQDAKEALSNGADRVSINTSAVKSPELISEISQTFGRQCVVVSIDAKRSIDTCSGFTVLTFGGSVDERIDLLDWVKEVQDRGAGEILLTSFDRDGTRAGYDMEMISLVSSRSSLPIIASGGCGSLEDFATVLSGAHCADAALASSVFHFEQFRIKQVKKYLRKKGLVVRL